MNCPYCKKEVLDEWVACPFCAARLSKVLCECGGELEPAWKACPHCGRPAFTGNSSLVGNDRAESVTEVSVERCFRIYMAAQRAFFAVFEDAFEKLANAGGASEMLTAISQRQLEERLRGGFQSLRESVSSEAEIVRRDASSVNPEKYFRMLSLYFSAIQTAEQNLAERNIPDGVLASMWRGAVSSLADPTTQGIATVLFPESAIFLAAFGVAFN